MVRETRKPMPWIVKPPTMTWMASMGSESFSERFAAWGPIMRRG